ncbi:hypothetical protein KD33_16840 [Clostridium sp. NCR]|nr:hypothetical protein KD33_16840 [Clostridium sp. NCR]
MKKDNKKSINCFVKKVKKNKDLVNIAISVLGLLAVIQSNILLSKTNKIYTYQAEISRQQIIPKINIFEQYVRSSDGTDIGSDEIVIENYGEGLNDFNSSIRTFYNVEYTSENLEHIQKEIPVKGYYTGQILTNRPTGTIATHTGKNNSKAYNEFWGSIINHFSDREDSVYIEKKSYIKVSYEDSLENEYEDYYVLEHGTGKKIDNKEGKSKFKQYDLSIETDKSMNVSTQSVSELKKILNVK